LARRTKTLLSDVGRGNGSKIAGVQIVAELGSVDANLELEPAGS